MRTLFNITPDQDIQRLQQTHLLILALLNFDHTVDIVFHNNSDLLIEDHQNLYQQWQALPLYGARDFKFLNSRQDNISQQHFHKLIQQADFVS